MAVIMFMKRLAPKVRDGSKRQTVRPKRKRRIKIGEQLSLREWETKAYRSKQIEIRKEPCVSVKPITIGLVKKSPVVSVDGHLLTAGQLEQFVRDDGIETVAEFMQFFQDAHGLPFKGEVIRW